MPGCVQKDLPGEALKCPFGLTDHDWSWRCHAAYAVDWLLGIEWLPDWIACNLIPVLTWLEQ